MKQKVKARCSFTEETLGTTRKIITFGEPFWLLIVKSKAHQRPIGPFQEKICIEVHLDISLKLLSSLICPFALPQNRWSTCRSWREGTKQWWWLKRDRFLRGTKVYMESLLYGTTGLKMNYIIPKIFVLIRGKKLLLTS